LVAHDGILPDRVRTLLPHMIGGNWLLNYAHIDGIARALRGMSRRASAGSKLDRASGDLTAGYDAFESEFLTFFPELRAHVDAWLASSDPYAPRQVE
jgi:acyl carrier protein phosphodiesterase